MTNLLTFWTLAGTCILINEEYVLYGFRKFSNIFRDIFKKVIRLAMLAKHRHNRRRIDREAETTRVAGTGRRDCRC